MKVTGPGPTNQPKKPVKTEKTSAGKGTAFARQLAGTLAETPQVKGADAPEPLTGVDAILAAQDVGNAGSEESKRRMAQRGEDILDQLEDLRLAILTGSVKKDKLAQIAQLVRQKREQGADPRMAAILDEIELRAEVELAKLTRDL